MGVHVTIQEDSFPADLGRVNTAIALDCTGVVAPTPSRCLVSSIQALNDDTRAYMPSYAERKIPRNMRERLVVGTWDMGNHGTVAEFDDESVNALVVRGDIRPPTPST